MRVLIIDDKPDERAALKTLIDWDALGFTIVGEAGNGIEAWEMMRSLSPEIVITDIVMPQMDGFEFIRQATEIFPATRFIIVSCHDQFKYAQAALRYHVSEYLLKPVISSELIVLLTRIKQDGASSREEDDSLLEQYMTSIQQALCKQLLEHSGITAEQARIRLKRCGLDMLADPPYAVFVGHVSPETALDMAIASMFPWFPKGFAAYQRDKSSFVALARCEHEAIITADRICNEARENEQFILTLGAAGAVSLEELPESRETAEIALEAAFGLGYGRAIDGRALPFPSPNNLDVIVMDQRVQQILQIKDADHARKMAEELIEAAPVTPNATRAFAIRAINACHVVLLNLHQAMETIGYDESGLYERVLTAPDRSSLIKLVREVLMATREYLHKVQSAHAARVVERMKNIMHERYEEKLTVEEIASGVHLHPVYASAVFKQTTGMTFMKYLTDIRMQKAMELLRKPFFVYEVCDKVGYWNRSHFTMTFKEYTGMTPREYANACGKED